MKEDLPSQDHLVSFPLLTILTGQGYISKVLVLEQSLEGKLFGRIISLPFQNDATLIHFSELVFYWPIAFPFTPLKAFLH